MTTGDMISRIRISEFEFVPSFYGIVAAHVVIENSDAEVLTKCARCVDDGYLAWNHHFKPGEYKIHHSFTLEDGTKEVTPVTIFTVAKEG